MTERRADPKRSASARVEAIARRQARAARTSLHASKPLPALARELGVSYL